MRIFPLGTGLPGIGGPMTLHFRPFLKPFYCEVSLFCTSPRAWIAAIFAVIRISGEGLQ